MRTGSFGTFTVFELAEPSADGQTHMLWFWCPGCAQAHAFYLPRWSFDGNYELPTVAPSLLIGSRPPSGDAGWRRRCHLFLKAGQLEFLPDCGHKLAGKIVPLPALPDWLAAAE